MWGTSTIYENSSSLSGREEKSLGSNTIFRNSIEVNYGLTDKWEAAIYSDYEKNPDESMKQKAFRVRTRKSFFEQGEMLVDTGLYLEAAFPKDSEESYTFETKILLEKELGRISLILNPSLEFVQLKEANEEGKTTELEKGYAAKVLYNYSSRVQPHLDLLGDIADEGSKQLLLAQVDLKVASKVHASVGVGMGLTPATEKQLIATKIEFEIY